MLEFKSLYSGKPVFELANKVIKFNRDFRIPHSKHILAPEEKIKYGENMTMIAFEKLDTRGVVKVSDNADKLYNYYQLLNSMESIQDQYGFSSKYAVLERFLSAKGYLQREESYIKFEKKQEEERKKQKSITPTEITDACVEITKSKLGMISKGIKKFSKYFLDYLIKMILEKIGEILEKIGKRLVEVECILKRLETKYLERILNEIWEYIKTNKSIFTNMMKQKN